MSEASSEISDSKDADNLDLQEPLVLKTSAAHQILTLVGTSFLCFEFIFLCLYFDKSWFAFDFSYLGLAALLLSVFLAHLLLNLFESNLATRLFAFWRKGCPLLCYRKWVSLDKDKLKWGLRQVRYEVVDEMELSWFGNLILRTRHIAGKDAVRADDIIKIQFAAANFAEQEILLTRVREKNPDLLLNKRLSLGRNQTMQKGGQITQLCTAGIMSLLLLDLGYSSFYYLELLKNYYLCQCDLLQNKAADAQKHFLRAEELRLHPLPISWVSGKFLNKSTASAGVWEARARVLVLQGKLNEAIEDSKKAIADAPMSLRHRLYQSRLLVGAGKMPEAKAQLEEILKEHKHALLVRLYILALAKEEGVSLAELAKAYKKQMDICYEDTFGAEPQWPPGGNRHFIEVLYSDDILFLLDRYLGTNYTPPAFKEEQAP